MLFYMFGLFGFFKLSRSHHCLVCFARCQEPDREAVLTFVRRFRIVCLLVKQASVDSALYV